MERRRTRRVLHAVDELGPDLQSLLVVATEQLLRVGISPTVVYRRAAAAPARSESRFDPRVMLIELPEPAPRHAWQRARVLRETLVDELAARRYDAVHLHSFVAGLVGRLAMAADTVAWPPVFYSPHGLRCLRGGGPLSSAMYRTLERMGGLIDCQPVGASVSEAQWLARLTGRMAPVLERPVAPALFDLPRQPDEQPLVITVGHACEQRGADLVAEVAARFHFAGQAARFVWVGDGDAHSEQVLRAAGVELTGTQEPDAVRRWLARAHVFLLPSRGGSQSLPLLQALSAEVPCVATDVACNRDAITHGVTGLLCRDVAALALHTLALLDAPQRAGRLAAAARSEARQRFSTRRFRNDMLWLYGLQGVLSRRRRALATPAR